MKLEKKSKALHPTKKGDSAYRIRMWACSYCDYTETVYGSNGIDSQRIEEHKNLNHLNK